jgi:flagellar hook assembly protein FlgD
VDADPDGLDLRRCVGGTTAFGSSEDEALEGVELYRPQPNPFTLSTRLVYEVAGSGEQVRINVYDLAGRRVRSLFSGFQTPGRHQVTWDGRNESGGTLGNGIYFVHCAVSERPRIVRIVKVQ